MKGNSSLHSFILCFLLFNTLCINAQTSSDVSNTAPVWRQAMGAMIIGFPVAHAETVALLCDDRSIRMYHTSGRELWRWYNNSKLLPFLARSNYGTSYIADAEAHLIAVNRAGRFLWKRKLNEQLSQPILQGLDGRIFALAGKELSAYTPAGFLLWRMQLPAKSRLNGQVDDQGRVFFLLDTNEIIRIDAFGSSSRISLEAEASAFCPLNTTTIAVSYTNGDLLLHNEGASAKRVNSGTSYITLYASESALIGIQSNGTIHYLDVHSNTTVWQAHTSADTLFRIQSDERGIYIFNRNAVAGFSPQGLRLWNLSIRGGTSFPAFSDDGLVYSGGKDWILYAYRMEDRLKKTSQHNGINSGIYSYNLAKPQGSFWFNDPWFLTEYTIGSELERIERALHEAKPNTNEPENTAFLLQLIELSTSVPLGAAPSRPPAVRLDQLERAINILGRSGSPELLPRLVSFFNKCKDSSIKASLAMAIGSIGLDTEAISLQAFSRYVFQATRAGDEQLLSAITMSIGSVCRFCGPPVSDLGIRLLVALNSPERPPIVRRQAEKELELLSMRAP